MSLYRAYALMQSPRAIVIPKPFKAQSAKSAETKVRRYLRLEDWGRPEAVFVTNIADPTDTAGQEF